MSEIDNNIISNTCAECEKSTGGVCVNHKVVHVERVVHLPDVCNKCKKPKAEKGMFVIGVNCKCGRPTQYTPELLAKCYEYINLKMPNKDTDEVIHSIEGLCDYPGVDISRETAYTWSKDKEKQEFSDIMQQVLKKQGKSLINGGVSDKFNGTITKLILTKHGYRDAVDNFNNEVPVDPEGKAKGDSAIRKFLSGKK